MNANMKLNTLVSTMNRDDYSFLDNMNLMGEVVVVNQCNYCSVDYLQKKEYRAKIISNTNKGLSNSRNEAILNSSCDIFLTADDDIVYRGGYEIFVSELFMEHPEADIITFNTEWHNCGNRRNESPKMIKEWKMASKNKYYSSVTLAYRKSSFVKAGLQFNPLFGAGAKFLSGEESLLLREARKAGLKIYESPEYLADVDLSESSWFTGYDEKYFYDKGAWIRYAYPKMYNLFKLYFLSKKRYSDLSWIKIIRCLNKGIKESK